MHMNISEAPKIVRSAGTAGRAHRRGRTILAAVAVVGVLLGSGAGSLGLGSTPTRTSTSPVGGVAAAASSATETGSSAPTAGGSTTASSQTTPAAQLASEALNESEDRGVPMRDVFLPSATPAPQPAVATDGHVVPGYTSAPAPMGVAEYGLRNSGGTVVPFVVDTSSVRGTFSTGSSLGVQPEYLDSGVPDGYSIQLNAVLTNVTLFGSRETGGTPNEFWTQNVVDYAAQLHQLQFVDNVWSFWPGFSQDTFQSYGPNGTFVYPSYYYAVGPTITISYPFSVTLYLNSTVIGGDNAVFFNYTLSNRTGSWSGSYDHVVFNSGGDAIPGKAQYQANGYSYDPVGLTNDFELTLGGPGGGSSTDIIFADAAMQLDYWDEAIAEYRAVPSPYDFGGDTGETSTGVSVGYTGTTAELTTGPALLHGLWNSNGTSGSGAGLGVLRIRLNPSNTFLFLGAGDIVNATVNPPAGLQWAPTIDSSLPGAGEQHDAVLLPPGEYTAALMLSDYTPKVVSFVLASGATVWLNVTLTRNLGAGIYTPLFAWQNGQIGGISSAGAGTPSSPYVLLDNEAPGQELSPLFGVFNDYGFPTFPGTLLYQTSAYVIVTNPPLSVAVPAWLVTAAQDLRLPLIGSLATWIIDARDVALVHSTENDIWFPIAASYADPADVMAFNSDHLLLADNTFDVSGGTGLFIYDSSSPSSNGTIVVWGNTFVDNNSVLTAPSCDHYCEVDDTFTGLQLMSDGQLVYNNNFSIDQTAWTPTSDWWSILTAPPVVYTDAWNVTPQPASEVHYDPDFPTVPLSGSIAGTPTQGGNFWNNYGSSTNPFGKIPYDAGGEITVGGDYDPLLREALNPVVLHVLVLAPNDPWLINIEAPGYALEDVFNGTGGQTVDFELPNGTYSISGYLVEPGTLVQYPGAEVATASFTVSGAESNLSFEFPADYLIVLEPVGYEANSTAWGICFTSSSSSRSPSPYTFSGGVLSVALTNGTWNFTSYVIDSFSITGPGCADAPKGPVAVAEPVGSILVSGADSVLPVLFNKTYEVTFTAQGAVGSGTMWVQDSIFGPSLGSFKYGASYLAINGTYTAEYASEDTAYVPYGFGGSGGQAYQGGPPGSVSFLVEGAPAHVPVTFERAHAVTFYEKGVPVGKSWTVSINGWTTTKTIDYSGETTAEKMTFYEANGSDSYVIAGPPGWTVEGYPAAGTVSIDGTAVGVHVKFVRGSTYTISFSERGVPNGALWCTALDGWMQCAENGTIRFVGLTPGNYTYAILPVAGESATARSQGVPVALSGNLTLSGASVRISIRFVADAPDGESAGAAGATWTEVPLRPKV